MTDPIFPLFKVWLDREEIRVALDFPPQREGESGHVFIMGGATLQEACEKLQEGTEKLYEIRRAKRD